MEVLRVFSTKHCKVRVTKPLNIGAYLYFCKCDGLCAESSPSVHILFDFSLMNLRRRFDHNLKKSKIEVNLIRIAKGFSYQM